MCTNAASRTRDGDPRFSPVALAGYTAADTPDPVAGAARAILEQSQAGTIPQTRVSGRLEFSMQSLANEFKSGPEARVIRQLPRVAIDHSLLFHHF